MSWWQTAGGLHEVILHVTLCALCYTLLASHTTVTSFMKRLISPAFILSIALALAAISPAFHPPAWAQTGSDNWGISQHDWLNAPGAAIRAKVDLVNQRSAIEAGVRAGDSRAQVLAAMAYQRGAWGG
jgi:hypothetical protein